MNQMTDVWNLSEDRSTPSGNEVTLLHDGECERGQRPAVRRLFQFEHIELPGIHLGQERQGLMRWGEVGEVMVLECWSGGRSKIRVKVIHTHAQGSIHNTVNGAVMKFLYVVLCHEDCFHTQTLFPHTHIPYRWDP